jgi:hypothetical protein
MGNTVEKGTFILGPDGKFLLKEGVVDITFPDGLTARLEVRDARPVGYRVSANTELLLQYTTGGHQIALNPDGTIYSGSFINEVAGAKLDFEEGKLVSFSMRNPDGGQISLDGMSLAQLTDLQKQGLIMFAASNGIWNRNPEGVPPNYEIDLMNRLVERGVDPASVFLVPLFEEGNIPKDTFAWIVDALGGDQLTDEIITKMDQKWITLTPEQQAQGIVSVLYSGSVNPFLKAVEERDYNISTIVSLGGPTLQGTLYEATIDNPNVNRFVNIYGEKDLVPLVGPIMGGDKSFSNVETLNIKILGAGHFDYFPTADGPSRIGKFVAEVVRLSGSQDENALVTFLAEYKDGDTYVIDPARLPDEY